MFHRSNCIILGATLVFVSGAAAQEKTDPVIVALNNVHADMVTCIAYFETLRRCIGDDPKRKEAADGYHAAADALLAKSFILSKEIGLTDDAAQSRLAMAAQDMVQLMQKNCINISSLLNRYSERCVEVSNDPLKPPRPK